MYETFQCTNEAEVATQVVAQIEAGTIARQAGSVVSEDMESEPTEDPGNDRLLLLQFNRCPKAVRNALIEGLPLMECRAALEQEGYSFLLPCGNMVFVHPTQYLAAQVVREDCGGQQAAEAAAGVVQKLGAPRFVLIHAPALSLPSASSGAFGP